MINPHGMFLIDDDCDSEMSKGETPQRRMPGHGINKGGKC